MSVLVRITPEAEGQIQVIHDWWTASRSAAPGLFLTELTDALDIIADAPAIGRLYRQAPLPQVRRLLLKATRYHIYYAPLGNDVVVLAVWHAKRGAGPPLRTSSPGTIRH